MKKLLCFFALYATCAFAGFGKTPFESSDRNADAPDQRNVTCTYLGGNWKGTCEGFLEDSSGKTPFKYTDEKLKVIQYDCETILLDGVTCNVGGLHKEHDYQGAGPVVGLTTLREVGRYHMWDEKFQVLKFVDVSHGSTAWTSGRTRIWTSIGQGDLSINDQKELTTNEDFLEGKFEYGTDQKDPRHYVQKCVYKRVE